MLNLRVITELLDDLSDQIIKGESKPSIYVNHNNKYDRPFSMSYLSEVCDEAKAGQWFDKSIWILGSDADTRFKEIGGFFNYTKDLWNRVRSNTPTASIYGRPVIVDDRLIVKDTISRIYLINYGNTPGEPIGAILRDLQ